LALIWQHRGLCVFAKGGHKVGKIFWISPILLTLVLISYGLSFGGQAAKGISLTNSSNELVYGPWILHQKGEAPSSSVDRAGFGITLYGGKVSKAIGNREVSMNPEITNSLQSPATTEFQKKELPDLENSQLSEGKPRYHFWEIHITRNNLDPSLSFISRLSSVEYEKENPLFRALENFKESDIFKSLAIFLELQLNF
jgi:hypothetical protein